LSPDAILVDAPDGTARLLDLDGQFYALSEVAAAMLHETLAHGPSQASHRVAERYGADLAVVAADLDAFLAELTRKGLLVEADRPPRRHRGGLLARMALAALLRLNRWLRPTLAGKASGMLTLAGLSCRWLGWARTVELWQKQFPAGGPLADEEKKRAIAQKIDEVVRRALAKLAVGAACKERGLTCWALARRAGLEPTMMVGISLYPCNAHCWTTVGPTLLGDEHDRCVLYQPVIRYPS
jgi:hypothetical protein